MSVHDITRSELCERAHHTMRDSFHAGTRTPRRCAAQLRDAVPIVRDAYYKLILAVGPARSGKTAALAALAHEHHWPKLNVNLRLSEQLLDLTQKQRVVRVAAILDKMLRGEASEVVLLDNIEMLFAAELA